LSVKRYSDFVLKICILSKTFYSRPQLSTVRHIPLHAPLHHLFFEFHDALARSMHSRERAQ
jgi:hypothetical protein